jgi:small subunit ribosomal protein S17
MAENPSNSNKIQETVGVVASSRGNKTCVVLVERVTSHPMYGKILRRHTRLAVHDPQNTAAAGDTVAIVPCRPISKQKHYRLVRVVKRATLAQQQAQQQASAPQA